MSLRAVLIRLLELVFVVETPRDVLVKCSLLMLAMTAVSVYVDTLFLGYDSATYWPRLGLRTLVSIPIIALICAIVTYLFRVQSQMTHLAMTDMLTSLPNRRSFIERTKALMVRGSRGYLLLIDADYFKQVNDTYGHAAGDDCLKALAVRLREVLDDRDVLGRVGGEEFAAYLPDGDRTRVLRVGKELTRAILVDSAETDEPIRMTLSIGATLVSPFEPVESAMQRADMALYQAKKTGRARLVVGPRMQAA